MLATTRSDRRPAQRFVLLEGAAAGVVVGASGLSNSEIIKRKVKKNVLGGWCSLAGERCMSSVVSSVVVVACTVVSTFSVAVGGSGCLAGLADKKHAARLHPHSRLPSSASFSARDGRESASAR